MPLRFLAPAFVFALLFTACGPEPPGAPVTVRLVDLFPSATVAGGGEAVPDLPRTEWLFDGGEDESGWQVAAGVDGLTVADGVLSGRASSGFPLVWAESTSEVPDSEVLHAVEVRARVSAGRRLAVTFDGADELDLGPILGNPFPWDLSTPVVAGDEVQLYTLTPTRTVTAADARRVLLRPADVEGAEFAVESLRLVFRKEHLASVPAGVGWHGMEEIYRESVVSRAGETVRFDLELPGQPRLDLGLATIDPWPATFQVTVTRGGASGDEEVALERTVTTSGTWHDASVDLSAFGGEPVGLTLAVSSENPGTVGFWGTPVIHGRGEDPAAAGPRGVIVIVGDTLRKDHLDLYGYGRPTAPVLSGLAKAGAYAEDCVTQATWTKVSVPAIFTSLYPTTHTVHQFTDRLPAAAETMAEVFRGAGWSTLGMSSITFTGRFTNLHQGYEEFHESPSLEKSSNSKTAREYTERLLPWLERHRDVPFFVFFHVADPHSPYYAYEPYDTLWGQPGDSDEYRRQQDEVRKHIDDPLMKRFGMARRSELEKAGLDPEPFVGYEHDAYDGSIRAMDVEVGRILELLRGLGLAEQTLVAFVSDHGTEFLEHDRHFHGHSVYGELNRVPLILEGPGVPAGVRIEPTVQAIDLMPTILELAGLEAPERIQGQSLMPLIRGEAGWRDRPAVTEKLPEPVRSEGEIDLESYAIIAGEWKLIHNRQRPAETPEFELYDHRADPLNLHDVASEHPDVVERLAAQIEGWHQQAVAARLPSDAELAEGMSAEELERLRSLGYL
jgi:arylsulfatase A-like enzyme